jgi:diguanylate cyclase (GGDEF)-like protein/PAS domain S-box-containing protein
VVDRLVPIDVLPAAALTCDAGGRVVAANARAAALFAAPAGALAGTALADLFPADADPRATLAAAGELPVRLAGRRRSGVPFTAEARTSPLPGGELLVLVEEVAGARLLGETQFQLDRAFEHLPSGMALFNTDGEYVRVNRALCRLLGRDEADVLGRRDNELTHPDDRDADVEAAWRILSGELDSWQCEKRFVRPDGQVVWVLANLFFLRDDAGRPLCWVGQFQDITGRKLAERRLRHMADHDDLTGIANRRRVVAEIELRLQHSAHAGERGAVLLLDLDGFKAVNDRLGHDAGDEVLKATAAALRQRLRATDLLGRLGGDEFAAVLPDIGAEDAMRVADELLAAVRAVAPQVSASCGIALYGPDRQDTADGLLAEADRAMYAAKRRGRDAACLA